MIARGRDPRPRPLTIPTAQAYYCPRPKPEHPSPSSRRLAPLPEDRRSRTDLKSEYQRPFLARAREPRHGGCTRGLCDRAHAVERLLAALRLFSLVDDHASDLREAPHAFGRTQSLRRRRPRHATATRRCARHRERLLAAFVLCRGVNAPRAVERPRSARRRSTKRVPRPPPRRRSSLSSTTSSHRPRARRRRVVVLTPFYCPRRHGQVRARYS